LALTLSSFKGGEIMSNIYWMNTIRRKQNAGSGKKYFDFRFDYHTCVWFWGQDQISHPYGYGTNVPPIIVGGQKLELLQSTGSFCEPITGKLTNDGQYKYQTIVDPESYQYIIFPNSWSSSSDVTSFINYFTDDSENWSGFQCPKITTPGVDARDFLLNNYIPDVRLYPYIIEYKTGDDGKVVTDRILKTYSYVNPNQHITSRIGTEPIQFDVNSQGFDVVLNNQSLAPTYKTMLTNIWVNYTPQISDSFVQYGFLGIKRGNTPSSLTPKNSIKWFLQRVTDVDINTQWTHARLS
jgi:hypothetical protein